MEVLIDAMMLCAMEVAPSNMIQLISQKYVCTESDVLNELNGSLIFVYDAGPTLICCV